MNRLWLAVCLAACGCNGQIEEMGDAMPCPMADAAVAVAAEDPSTDAGLAADAACETWTLIFVTPESGSTYAFIGCGD
jgi:hypothetical protein